MQKYNHLNSKSTLIDQINDFIDKQHYPTLFLLESDNIFRKLFMPKNESIMAILFISLTRGLKKQLRRRRRILLQLSFIAPAIFGDGFRGMVRNILKLALSRRLCTAGR